MRVFLRSITFLLVIIITYFLLMFSTSVEDYTTTFDFILSVLFFFILAFISQLGLLLSTTQFGQKHKLITLILMMPFFILTLYASYELMVRLISHNHASMIALLSYIAITITYIIASALLFKTQKSRIFK